MDPNRLIMGEISGISTADLNNVDGFFTTQGGGGTVTPTPQTASIASTQYSDGTLTISNTGSYTQLSVFCEIDANPKSCPLRKNVRVPTVPVSTHVRAPFERS